MSAFQGQPFIACVFGATHDITHSVFEGAVHGTVVLHDTSRLERSLAYWAADDMGILSICARLERRQPLQAAEDASGIFLLAARQ